MQYVPRNGVYVYFRYDDTKTVMIVTNTMAKETSVETARFNERMKGFGSARNVMTNEVVGDLGTLKIPGKTALVLELGK